MEAVHPFRRRVAPLALVLTAALGVAPAPVEAQRASRRATPQPPGIETLAESQLRDYLTFIAADELQGRRTPSLGLDIAARFLATLLSRWGYEPAGDEGSYFQSIALTRRVLDAGETSLSIGKQTLTLGEQYLPDTTVTGTASGPLVYIGHGVTVKAKGIDPWAEMDVRGKIVILHPGTPQGIEQRDLQGPKGEGWNDGPGNAAERGAVGILYLADFRALDNWPRSRARLSGTGALVVDAFRDAPGAPQLPSATLAPSSYATLFTGESVSASDIHARVATRTPVEPFALSPSKQVSLTVATRDTPTSTKNVVAVLRGSHPTLRDEYVALGAHYDHLGMASGVTDGDAIYNGADDDGSGTVGLLGMAEAFAKAPTRPKRSILFVWHAGEEIGLWGARYFSERPTVPLGRIVTQINVDMIGRSRAPDDSNPDNAALTGPDAVYVIGSRLMSTQLGTLVDDVNERYLKLSYDYGYADPNHPDRFFYRSDHYHYAKHGIPVVFFFTGVHEDYHGLGDHVDKIDFRKMTRIARTIYATAWAVAELPKRPVVDTPLGRELLTR